MAEHCMTTCVVGRCAVWSQVIALGTDKNRIETAVSSGWLIVPGCQSSCQLHAFFNGEMVVAVQSALCAMT